MIRKILINKSKHIHFIGIGGISMSSLAKFCLDMKKRVSGSDLVMNAEVKKLKKLGITIFKGHRPSNIKKADLVVYTSAISADNKELLFAIHQGIPIMERAEFLGGLSEFYNTVIAVAGTHGKTTTTAMIAKVFIDAGLNPSVHLGGNISFLDGNTRIGKDIFITEACEYKKSFLKIKTNYSVVTNIEPEHLECYGSFKKLKQAFEKFLKKASNYAIANSEYVGDDNYLIKFSLNNSADNFYVKNIQLQKNGGNKFEIWSQDKKLSTITVQIMGKHNIMNALTCFATCYTYGIDIQTIQQSLTSFYGVQRRFEYLGQWNNATIIQDYAHHPTEIKNTLTGFREFYQGELIVVFQPHTYSRTLDMLQEFVEVFSLNSIDDLIFIPTYPAREKLIKGGTSKDIFTLINKKRKNVHYIPSVHPLYSYLKSKSKSYTTILFLGAGNIENIACKLFK